VQHSSGSYATPILGFSCINGLCWSVAWPVLTGASVPAACPHLRVLLLRREPVKSEGPLPLHLIEPLKRSLTNDKFVADEGNIVFYQKELQAEPARR
jgi:hypothetical protein